MAQTSRGRRLMGEINVVPYIDVMLVLLIIFMVSAPLLTVGVPLELPQSQAKSLEQDREPLTGSVNAQGQIFLQSTEIKIDDLIPKLKAIIDARNGGTDERIYVRGDKKVDYGAMMRVMGRLSAAGVVSGPYSAVIFRRMSSMLQPVSDASAPASRSRRARSASW